jgi:jumonji domain-containing protein 7
VYTGIDPDHPDYTKYPLFKYAKPLYAELKAGEMLYLPSHWYHLVKSGPGRSLAVNYWYQPVSSVSAMNHLVLSSAHWRDPNDPNAPLVHNRKGGEHEEH